MWVVITTLVVMQPDDRSNYRRILERIIGTLAGVAVAFVLTQFVRAEPLVFAALVVTAAALPHHIPVRYWLHTAAIALLVMLIYDLASRVAGDFGALSPGLFKERVVDVLVGCLLALVGTELGFSLGRPREARIDQDRTGASRIEGRWAASGLLANHSYIGNPEGISHVRTQVAEHRNRRGRRGAGGGPRRRTARRLFRRGDHGRRPRRARGGAGRARRPRRAAAAIREAWAPASSSRRTAWC